MVAVFVLMLSNIGLTPAHAQSGIAGVVKASNGGTALSADGRERALKPGDAVHAGERLRTGAGGALALTMRDDTRIALGANSSLQVQSFAFDSRRQQGNMTIRVLRGVSTFVSGLLAKSSPDAFQVVTPTATAGIRGTEFIVDVEGGSDD